MARYLARKRVKDELRASGLQLQGNPYAKLVADFLREIEHSTIHNPTTQSEFDHDRHIVNYNKSNTTQAIAQLSLSSEGISD
jgi:hypothetical protein